MSCNNCKGNCQCPNKSNGNCNTCKEQKLDFKCLSQLELYLLNELTIYQFLPLVQYAVTSTTDDNLVEILLSPIYLENENFTLEQVEDYGNALYNLSKKGFIILDYDVPLMGCDYSEYIGSKLAKEYMSQINEQDEKFIVVKGSMTLTKRYLETL